METSLYKEAGVDIDAATDAVDRIKPAVRSTYGPEVLADVGSFGGLFALQNLPGQPVLVASTDSVGTKAELGARLGRWSSLGHDIVNHCVNDILVQNARPLFFLDYLATSKVSPAAIEEIVVGIAEACRFAGCALLGGEIAEMPGVYTDGAYDIVGSIVGLVDRTTLLPHPEQMQEGDLLFGMPSSGPHTNGYTLIRKALAGKDLEQPLHDGGPTIADAVLAPHRCYVPEIDRIQAAGIGLKGMAHITGGGLLDNTPRVLPDQLAAEFVIESERIPVLFQRLVQWSGMQGLEPFRVLNMGVGMVLIVDPADASTLQTAAPEAFPLGKLVARDGDPVRIRQI
ncbi:MAG: phosphoribosylformylglycinamidine cyclo-ligase [Planctomycetales bacterium]|nr:phosphoribosylformylglycinamidine cyclo-ligase [Planctomycetales bacterium]